MNEADFRAWLAEYRRAWEKHDAGLIGRLFTDHALYFIKPFDEPLRGRANIMQYWRGISRTQADVCFEYDVLAVCEAVGLAHWHASFR